MQDRTEARLSVLEAFIERQDKFAEKTADAVVAIERMLVIHDERQKAMLSDSKEHYLDDAKEFDAVQRRFHDVRSEIERQMGALRRDLKEDLKTVSDNVANAITAINAKTDSAITTVKARVWKLEIIKWMGIGAGFILAIVAGHFGFAIPWP